MKATGITRKVDELGRIVLPKELRKIMDIEVGAPLEIFVDGENIIVHKYLPACVFCGNAEHISEFKGKKVCQDCLKQLKKLNL